MFTSLNKANMDLLRRRKAGNSNSGLGFTTMGTVTHQGTVRQFHNSSLPSQECRDVTPDRESGKSYESFGNVNFLRGPCGGRKRVQTALASRPKLIINAQRVTNLNNSSMLLSRNDAELKANQVDL
jgi:hypothetical protein